VRADPKNQRADDFFERTKDPTSFEEFRRSRRIDGTARGPSEEGGLLHVMA
jgi:hypothetical protein